MTISYSGNFLRLLVRWKGSIWRSAWKELIVYLAMFYSIRFFYVVGIDLIEDDDDDARKWRRKFEAICRMFDGYCRLIPLTFLLGFYVSNVVARWWRQFECLSWPEDLISVMCSVIHGSDEKSQKRRHMIARYLNLSAALAWRDISSKIRLRFPTVSSLISAGLLTEKEYDMLEEANESCSALRWMTPLHWIQQILRKEEEEVKAAADRCKPGENKPTTSLLNHLITELKLYRQSLRRLFCYDWVCVPLVYTQVAALATYAFFFFALFGRQTLLPDIESGKEVDLLIPVFLIVQFLFFVGWFKVGQDLMRPFGLDDDDIELNYILDRNIQASFTIVNKLQLSEPPDFEEDVFWQNRTNKVERLPHTEHSRTIAEHPPKLHSYVKVGECHERQAGCFSTGRGKKNIGW